MLHRAQSPSLSVDPATGLVAPARQCTSPNQDLRPSGAVIDLIVVHGISLPPGAFGGDHVRAFFCNQLDTTEHPYFASIADLRVSAHALVHRDGALTQFVAFDRRAWHAGVSSHNGRERCNDFSVGIELEGCDDVPYASAQYNTLAALIAALRATYPTLANADVVGHSDIAPGRKTDPGAAFDWTQLDACLALCAGGESSA
ncbi:MAG: 1,6-anhydro-N-acetylmuramyl-L-alanine amidase AmpD [Pseudomonadota bacterium]